ncbi:coiled-coil domain-containing protein [Thiomicrorhabdus heinhorstiae]|uniref:Heme biosynthesis operon protein HemX n=1 Tax=Thiomicrorhabdus heinhorstiae TaxID=2748010 RepID=A0ABS0BYU9_9GAMM|nr:hypothetical protein [Thiomicrorhabdus heinhorstiae]MBF6058969.1 hypothetical protein [Thiomicrorhabdus heinhorstiae]
MSEQQHSSNGGSVYEGEVMAENLYQKASKTDGEDDAKPASEEAKSSSRKQSSKPPSGPSFLRRNIKQFVWGGLLIGVAAALVYSRPNNDWEVDHINRLQAQVAALNEQQAQLKTQLQLQETALNEKLQKELAKATQNPDNKPLVSQGDLQAIQQATQEQLDQLQSRLAQLSEQFAEKLNQVGEAVKPDEETLQGFKDLEQQWQQKLNDMGQEIAKLWEKKPVAEASPQKDKILTSLQLQEWILAINTQWLLKAEPEATQQQLLALEQAIIFSRPQNAQHLSRLIGEDITYLKLFGQQQKVQMPQLDALRDAVKNLSLQLPDKQVVIPQESKPDAGIEMVDQASAWQALLQRFSQLVSIKKRDGEEDMTKVESLLMQQVLKQRLLLLVDRLQWAAETRDASQYKEAEKEIEAFAKQHFPQAENGMQKVLLPLREVEFKQPQPLAILQSSGLSSDADSASGEGVN